MLIINYKTYHKMIGRNGLEFYRKTRELSRKYGVKSFVAPPVFDLYLYKKKKVLSQHVDPIHEGRGTGKIPVDVLREYGISGSLINHSENPMKRNFIKEVVEMLNDSGMVSVVCGSTPYEVKKYSKYGPDYVAFEPPELIGTGISVSEARSELIEKCVNMSKVPVLVGAGIHSKNDVKRSLDLGAEGVLVASFVDKSPNPLKSVKELFMGFSKR